MPLHRFARHLTARYRLPAGEWKDVMKSIRSFNACHYIAAAVLVAGYFWASVPIGLESSAAGGEAAGSKPRAGQLKCGAAETVITRVKDRPEVYADLYARAMVLEQGPRRMAIVTADMGTFSYAYSDVLVDAIHKATGIEKQYILTCASQTHNAPGVDGRQMSATSKTWLAGEMARLVKRASENVRPATLRVSRAPAQIGYNRRLLRNGQVHMAPNPEGAVVPWVDVLSAYDEEGKRIGTMFSHAAHPVIVHGSVDATGPDFPGYAIEHLRKLLAPKGEADGIFMFTQACCGNINGYPLRGGIAACDAAGLSLAHSVTEALDKEHEISPGAVRSRSMTLSLPLQDPPSLKECQEVLAREPDNVRYQELLRMAQSGKRPVLPFPMHAIAIGDDVCILTFKGEMFAEYQLFAEKVSPFKHTFVLIHVNGIGPYVATEKAYALGNRGGYEAWGFMTSRPPYMPFHRDSEKMIHDGIVQLLGALKRGE